MNRSELQVIWKKKKKKKKEKKGQRNAQTLSGFWWDGENQNTVGDFLCARGLHVKFRNPRKSGSVYPSLFVDWFDEDHVAQLVNELHEKSK
jgi:hypothetical protein